ncbi:MAG: response regulator transcription factor [Thermomicrobiales bacterium]|nr:response regulator transcription factor [Thermomicrobiales bacterium]
MAIVQNDATERSRQILIVEDEPSISGFVRRGLIFEGFDVSVVDNGTDALLQMRDNPPDLVVLDLMLPGIDGIQITQRVRAAEEAEGTPRLPILMLTARDAVADRVNGLDAGADDYLIKPFDFDELVARVRALLRRATPTSTNNQEVLTFENITVNLTSHIVSRDDQVIELTPREFDLLVILMRHPNQVLTRQTLMQRVWGEDFYGESNVLEVVIGNLRRALETNDQSRVVQTVRGIGYVLRSQ